jgi:hypothetical protein
MKKLDKSKMNMKYVFIGMVAMSVSLGCFGQDCDKFLNKQTNVINTKGIVVRILGKAADAILGTNFSSLQPKVGDQLQMLDVLQYNTCMQLQTIKNDFVRENLQEKAKNTLAEMLKLLTQSGALTPEIIGMLAENGVVEPGVTVDEAPAVNPQPVKPPATADEVDVPVLPVPATPGWATVTFPCQRFTDSGDGIIRARGMETHSDPQIAKSIANVVALEELASKIEITVNSVTEYYIRSVGGDNEELIKDFQRLTKTKVNQTLRGYKTVCEEYRQHSETQKYQCFIALEISEENVLKPVYEGLKTDAKTKNTLPGFDKFKNTFIEVMKFYESTGF